MVFAKDSSSANAMGGTELLKHSLESLIDKDLLDNFQIFVSRVEEELDPTKIRLLWVHDLHDDPASHHLYNMGWKNFNKIIFVSNHQMQNFIKKYDIPWSKCIVIQNAIVPIPEHEKPKDKIRLGYWSTPHRGLNILLPVFELLQKTHPDIELDVFSSFDIYGWPERNKHYEDLFQKCKDNPNINYYGSVSNDVIRKSIENIHILAYPSIWEETSCLTLMEAMSGGCLCVHSNLGALPETSANWTLQYQFNEDLNTHAGLFYHALESAIDNFWDSSNQTRIHSQQSYASVFYNWEIRKRQWESYLTSLLNEDRSLPVAMFEYKT